jgi:hypothetical protein
MGDLLVLWLRSVPAEMEPFFTGPNSFDGPPHDDYPRPGSRVPPQNTHNTQNSEERGDLGAASVVRIH